MEAKYFSAPEGAIKPYCVKIDVTGTVRMNKDEAVKIGKVLRNKMRAQMVEIGFTDIGIHVCNDSDYVTYLFTNQVDKEYIEDIILE